jgi:hypothetical protein
MTDSNRQGLAQVFAIPALLAGLSLFGLVASLVGDGVWDVAGALALLVPAGVALVKLASGLPIRQGRHREPFGMQRSFQG